MTPCIIEIKHKWYDNDGILQIAVWNYEISNVPSDVCLEVFYRLCDLAFSDFSDVIVLRKRVELCNKRDDNDMVCLRVLNSYNSSCVLFGDWSSFGHEIESCLRVSEDDFV